MPDVGGAIEIVPRSGLGFPWGNVVRGEERLAAVGRYSALNIFLGRGQRIELADGERWRLKSVKWHRYVCPRVVDSEGLRLSTSAVGPGNYAITSRDRGFTLIPAEKRPGRPRAWELLEFDEPVGRVDRNLDVNPYIARMDVEVPLHVVLLSFALAAFGIMGEKDLLAPAWGSGSNQ